MYHCQLARHGEDSTLYSEVKSIHLGSFCCLTLDAVSRSVTMRTLRRPTGDTRTSKLWGGSTHQCYEAGCVDDATASVQALGLVGRVIAHSEDGVFATPPHTLQVDGHGEIPDALLCVECVIVCWMHDTYGEHANRWSMEGSYCTSNSCLTCIIELNSSLTNSHAQGVYELILTITSSRPNNSTALSTAALTSASLLTSALTALALTFGYFSFTSLRVFSAASMLTSTRRTSAPSCAKRSDDSSPMPLDYCHMNIRQTYDRSSAYEPAPVIKAD